MTKLSLALTAVFALLAAPALAFQEAEILKSGTFMGAEGHDAAGTARIVREDEMFFLEFEGFETDRGPDLFVWLAEDSVQTSAAGKSVEHVSLGRLQGAKRASQRYEIPAGTEIDDAESVVIWCRAFGILFGSADLSE